jgi:hypothetical protein
LATGLNPIIDQERAVTGTNQPLPKPKPLSIAAVVNCGSACELVSGNQRVVLSDSDQARAEGLRDQRGEDEAPRFDGADHRRTGLTMEVG